MNVEKPNLGDVRYKRLPQDDEDLEMEKLQPRQDETNSNDIDGNGEESKAKESDNIEQRDDDEHCEEAPDDTNENTLFIETEQDAADGDGKDEEADGNGKDEEEADGDGKDEEEADGDGKDEEAADGDGKDEEADGDGKDEEEADGDGEDEEEADGDGEVTKRKSSGPTFLSKPLLPQDSVDSVGGSDRNEKDDVDSHDTLMEPLIEPTGEEEDDDKNKSNLADVESRDDPSKTINYNNNTDKILSSTRPDQIEHNETEPLPEKDISQDEYDKGSSEGTQEKNESDDTDKNSSPETTPIKPVDIVDAEQYMEKLKDKNGEQLQEELFSLCQAGNEKVLRKLDILCKYLTVEKKMPLHNIRGKKYKETCLHVALLLDNKAAADKIIDYGGKKIVVMNYDHQDNQGTTALHLAVVKGHIDIIHKMCKVLGEEERGNFIHQQATGSFFRNNFDSIGLPLILAAMCGETEIFKILLQYGADLYRCDDITGNNIIHSLVQYSLHNSQHACHIYKDIMNSPKLTAEWLAKKEEKTQEELTKKDHLKMKRKLLKEKNELNLSPLLFSCRLGAQDMLEAMLATEGVYRHPQWQYGPIKLDYYDVTELDDSACQKKQLSGLELLVYAGEDNNLPIFSTEVISSLVALKWRSYRSWFWFWAVCHVILMIVFTGTVIGKKKTEQPMTSSAKALFLCGDVIVLLSVLFILGQEIYEVVLACKTWRLQRKQKASIRHKLRWYTLLRLNGFRPIIIIFAILTVVWFILRQIGSANADLVAAPTLIIGWYWTLFFTRAFKNIGVFTVMLNKMIFRDVFYFGFAFSIILVGFSVAFMALVPDSSSQQNIPDELKTFTVTIWSLLRQAVGLFDMEEVVGNSENHAIFRILLFFFIILSMVLLLNMLIAAMSDTYAAIANCKDDLWCHLLVESVFILERRLPPRLRPKSPLKTENKSRFIEIETVHRIRLKDES